LRLTHTKLADAILDICEVPSSDQVRRICLHLLTKCSAPPPSSVLPEISENCIKNNSMRKDSNNRPPLLQILENLLEEAVKNHGLPQIASKNLKIFLTHDCLPLPTDVTKALQNLQQAAKKIRSMNEKNRKSKRFVDIAKGIKSLQNLVNTLQELGIIISPNESQSRSHGMLPPAFISLDLGLRQRQKHFHGQLYFQALLLPDNWQDNALEFNSNDTLLSHPKQAVKVAEGGHYEDIVRRFRPPGNFGSVQLDKYTSAPIPFCFGTRFFVRRFVEQAYVEASKSAEIEVLTSKVVSNADIESIRKSLGHPFQVFPRIQCVIVGTNGFDAESLLSRAMVATKLWLDGISAEYVAQSGVILSLLKHTVNHGLTSYSSVSQINNILCFCASIELTNLTYSIFQDWTIDQIEGICSILKIPFLIIVQDHLLRDKKSVRLRLVKDLHHDISTNEDVVILSSLASVLKDHLYKNDYGNETDHGLLALDRSKAQNLKQPQNQDAFNPKNPYDIECVFVDTDQFYCEEHFSGRDPKSKSIWKLVNKCTQRAEDHILRLFTSSAHGEGCIVLAAHLPFIVIREFDSIAMFGSKQTVTANVSETILKHTKYRKTLKTLALCLDHLIRRHNGKNKPIETKKMSMFSAFIYSIEDDRFDLLQLSL
jgi:hypothetical protein